MKIEIPVSLSRLPYSWANMGLILIAGLVEGIGLILFVPLLDLMTKGTPDQITKPFDIIADGYVALGITVTPLTMVAGIAIAVITSLVIVFAQRSLLAWSRQRYKQVIRQELVDSLFSSSWPRISEISHGGFINLLLEETDRASNALQNQVLCVATVMQIMIYLAFSSTLSWELLGIAGGFGAVVIVGVRPLLNRARDLGHATDNANHNVSFQALDHLKAAKLIKATGTEGPVLSRLGQYIEFAASILARTEINSAQVSFWMQALPALLLTGIIAIANEALHLDTSLLLVFLIFIARFAPRLAQMQQYYQGYLISSPAIALVDNMVAANRENSERTGGDQLDQLNGTFELEDVVYRYENGTTAVDGVSVSIPRNQMIAFVGSSGSGKSTLIDLIAGLRAPTSGRVLIDGHDLAQMDMHSWRRCIGYVTQDAVVFNDTIANNLRFAHPAATNEDIRKALRVAYLSDFVDALPLKLETVLGESGVRLSGGQRQRLALARALVGNPQLLLLDEATSSLDNEAERIVQHAMEELAHSVTMVVVAHRLSTISAADRIYVMEDGRIVESGTYKELLSAGGRFANLHALQFS